MATYGTVFDDGEDLFAAWAPRVWDPLGDRCVAAVRPRPGQRVLDACCGAGASALPAAREVGPGGHVDAVDMSERLLARGRERAGDGTSISFRHSDIMEFSSREPYDLVQCAYGVFFLPDLDAAGRHLLDLVRPGGSLAVTVWEAGRMERIVRPLAEAVQAVTGTPPAAPGKAAAGRLATADGLTRWLSEIGGVAATVQRIEFTVPITDPAEVWDFVRGNGARRMLAGCDGPTLERIRARYLSRLDSAGFNELDCGSLVGVARRQS